MTLAEWLSIRPGVTAVVGSGGKTTLLRVLGEELTAGGSTVILCTTTKIFPFSGLENLLSPTETLLAEALQRNRLVCTGTLIAETGKLAKPSIPIAYLASLADYVLVEADGAAHRPLKAHESHEPVIPPEAGRTVCMIGISGFGQVIRKAAHRPKRFAELAGMCPEDTATPEAVSMVLAAEALADIYFFNQADTPERWEWGRRGMEALRRPAVTGALEKGAYGGCLL